MAGQWLGWVRDFRAGWMSPHRSNGWYPRANLRNSWSPDWRFGVRQLLAFLRCLHHQPQPIPALRTSHNHYARVLLRWRDRYVSTLFPILRPVKTVILAVLQNASAGDNVGKNHWYAWLPPNLPPSARLQGLSLYSTRLPHFAPLPGRRADGDHVGFIFNKHDLDTVYRTVEPGLKSPGPPTL